MAKKTLKFDVGSMRDFVAFYELTTVDDGYGGTTDSWVLSLDTKARKSIKSKTSQSMTMAGSFDFYQIFEFIIRDRKSWIPEKDMIIYNDGAIYVIKGVATMENNPNYLSIYTETINNDNHALWKVINAMPIQDDKPNIIDAR